MQYNARPKEARGPLDSVIKSALQHAKYKAGLVRAFHPSMSPSKLTCGTPNTTCSVNTSRLCSSPLIDAPHHDVSNTWLELTLLSECIGPLQQDVLLTLCNSLNQSPVSASHIPSLLYIAGLCYQWLKSDHFLSKAELRRGELVLLKDYCTKEEVRQLKFDLEGFEKNEQSYRSVPESLFHWKFSLEIGLMVCEYFHGNSSIPDLQALNIAGRTEKNVNKSSKKGPCSGSSKISYSGGYGYPILWHALDIWNCTKQGSEVLLEAIQDFLTSSTEFSKDKWMEGFLAMSILCTTSQLNLCVLNLVQSLAKGSDKSPLKTKATTLEASSPSNSPEDKQVTLKFKFSKPAQMKLGDIGKLPMSNSPRQRLTARKMPTLNMLGMQPDFNVPDGESLYTSADRTAASHSVFRQRGSGGGNRGMGVHNAPGIDYIKHMHAQHLMNRLGPATEYSTISQSTLTPESIRTQSLIENESIPDPLPSTITSNITVLDMMESNTTIDPGESLGKSAGLLFMSNSSKLMDITVSDLVSPCLPCLLPSGELESIEELVGSGSNASDVELKESNDRPRNMTMKVSNASSRQNFDMHGIKAMEDYRMNLNQLKSPEELWQVVAQDKNRENMVLPPVKPQQVKVPESERRSVTTRYTHYTHSTAPLAGGAITLGSQVHPSTTIRYSNLFSTASSFKLPAATVKTETTSISSPFVSWPSEVAMAYVTGMAGCAIYGRTSLIQRTAMEGFVGEDDGISDGRGTGARVCGSDQENQYGLLDMAEFQAKEQDGETSGIGWTSWCIRYLAIMGLSRVNKTCLSLPMKDDLSAVALSKLIERQTCETDKRVLKAFNMSQDIPDMDSSIKLEDYPFSCPLMAHIADGLIDTLLSSTKNIPEISIISRKPVQPITIANKRKDFGKVEARVNSKLDHSKLSRQPGFSARANGMLHQIAAEDWRRQMEQELEQELEQEEIEQKQEIKRKIATQEQKMERKNELRKKPEVVS